MYTSEDVLEAARVIRHYLPDLMVGAEAEAVDRLDAQLADQLIAATSGQSVTNQIWQLLTAQESTCTWLTEFLQIRQNPNQPRSFSGLPGDISIVGADKFVCPYGDYVWYRPRVGMAPPLCPTHQVSLVNPDSRSVS